MKDQRPKPENFLQRAKEEDHQRGKLKIYFGAAPGVGKTHAMLEAALDQREEGLDIVVGVVESHGRVEIEAMLKQLEIVPKQKVSYHGHKIAEFDLDAALKRNPGIILMDEMAHTNAPGLRHNKRWQDIKELLDRGIDVYTTLNVQHVESLNDVVSQIIHTKVKETVPDSMLEMADTVELIDLPPEDLLKRLQEGKVYVPKQAEMAIEHFFRKGNLTALRELALRVTAERVSAQVLLYRQGQSIKHIWPTKEKLLVCIGQRTGSTKLVRAARRMAKSLRAEWIAVHVKTTLSATAEEVDANVIKNLRLAEQLGAQTKIVTGLKVETEIANVAHEHNITKIIIGKHPRTWWQRFFLSSLTDKIMRASGEIDVYSITEEVSPIKTTKPVRQLRPKRWPMYVLAIGIVATMTVFNLLLFPYLHTSNLIMIYLFGIIIVSLFGMTGPAIFTSIMSIFAYGLLFIPPFYQLNITDTQFIFTLMVMLMVSYIISHLTTIMRRQTEIARGLEKRTATLHELSRRLAGTRGIDELLDIAVHYIADVFDSAVLALLPAKDKLAIQASSHSGKKLNEKEQSIAKWVYDLGQPAGLGTDTLSFSDAVYLPLLVQQQSIGVLRICPLQHHHLFTPEQMHLLENCATQIAWVINVDQLQEQKKLSELKLEKDRTRKKLLDAMAHDLKNPIVAVLETASTFMANEDEIDTSRMKKFGGEIYVELEKLNQLINNFLQIAQLEGEQIKLKKQIHSLNDTVTAVIESARKTLGKKNIHLQIPADLPTLQFDKTLLQEVFVNLIDNATKFTPPESPIEISACRKNEYVIVSVEDCGPGIAPEEAKKLFDKYYRGKNLTAEGGLGLGLAICRIIIVAHGGKIWAENRSAGGAAFYFTLPL